MGKLSAILREFFSDPQGNLSVMRLQTFLILSNIMVIWSWHAIFSAEWKPLDVDTMLFIVGILGAKAYQRKVEKGE